MHSSSSSSTNHHLPPPQTTAATKRKAGRKKFQETRHPIYKGVRQRNGKWVSELRQPNKKSSFWVGTFSNPKTAAVAYDVVALAIKGESAALNFPELAHSFPRVKSLAPPSTITDIRAMAVETAGVVTSRGILSSSLPSFVPCSSLIMLEDQKVVSSEVFLDEEEVFNMPAIINGMAEGLILTPPGMKKGFNWEEEYETSVDLSLWSDK